MADLKANLKLHEWFGALLCHVRDFVIVQLEIVTAAQQGDCSLGGGFERRCVCRKCAVALMCLGALSFDCLTKLTASATWHPVGRPQISRKLGGVWEGTSADAMEESRTQLISSWGKNLVISLFDSGPPNVLYDPEEPWCCMFELACFCVLADRRIHCCEM